MDADYLRDAVWGFGTFSLSGCNEGKIQRREDIKWWCEEEHFFLYFEEVQG